MKFHNRDVRASPQNCFTFSGVYYRIIRLLLYFMITLNRTINFIFSKKFFCYLWHKTDGKYDLSLNEPFLLYFFLFSLIFDVFLVFYLRLSQFGIENLQKKKFLRNAYVTSSGNLVRNEFVSICFWWYEQD